MGDRWIDRAHRAAPFVLAASIVVRSVNAALGRAPYFMDLAVYAMGGAALDSDTLYTVDYVVRQSGEVLPFTMPPFAAMLFYPMQWVPFGVLVVLWFTASIAATYGVVRLTQKIMDVGDRRQAMLWTAAAIWLEPVDATLALGQVGVFLALAALGAVYTTRWWLSGLLVGASAGIKLIPAITGVYLLLIGRWKAALCAVGVGAATVVIAFVCIPNETRHYFREVFGDPGVVPFAYATNQSWRGALSRIVGHDVGNGLLLLTAIVATAVVAVFAWRAVDDFGKFLVIQMVGLLVSPISWIHHWVWVIPLAMWLAHTRREAGARALAYVWLACIFLAIPSQLGVLQTSLDQVGRPWHLAWAGLLYPALTLVTMAWMARRRTVPAPSLP